MSSSDCCFLTCIQISQESGQVAWYLYLFKNFPQFVVIQGKFGLGVQNVAGQRLIEFYQKNTLVVANTLFQQHKKRLYTWKLPDCQYWNQIACLLCSQGWKSSIESTKTRPGADFASNHELLIAKFRLQLKKVGKTTRLFRYDLNQITYDYTVEVKNKFKGLDLVDRVPEELWTEVRDIV